MQHLQPYNISNFIKHKLLPISLFWVYSSQLLFCQIPYFQTFSPIKNKKDYTINKILQDSKGFIWFGTSEGLIRTDGTRYDMIGTKNMLNGKNVTALGEDTLQRIWVGYQNGKIDFLEGDVVNAFEPEEGIGNSPISEIYFAQNGSLWFTTLGEGVYYYKGKNRTRLYNLNTDDSLSDNYVYSVCESKDGTIYFSTDNGISVFDPINEKISGRISMKDGLPDNIVKKVLCDSNGNLWIGTLEAGLCLYNLSNKSFTINPGWNFGNINTFVLSGQNEAWVSTEKNGLVRINLNTLNNSFGYKQFKANHGLYCNNTYSIFHDREGLIWVGCQSGITKINGNLFEFVDQRDGFEITNIFSNLTDQNNRYWIASENGLFCYQMNPGGNFNKTQILGGKEYSQAFVSLYEDKNGHIWAGTYGFGLFKINPGNFAAQSFHVKDGLNNENIVSITGRDHKIWFATLGGGAVFIENIDNPVFKNLNQASGLAGDYIYHILADSKNRIWFAHDGDGYSMQTENKFFNNSIPDTLADNTYYSIVEDAEGSIWFHSANKGLIRFDGKNYFLLDDKNGLKSNNIRSIYPTPDTSLYILSNEGVEKFNIKRNSIEFFGEDEGVAYLEPNLNAIRSDQNENIWVGAQNGAFLIKNQNKNLQKVQPLISINNVLLFYKRINPGKVTFNYNENHISFEYTGIWFRSPSNLVYRYKLDNYDLDWSQATLSRTVTYSNLPAGHYTFMVEVSNQAGTWVGSSKSVFSFTIYPPFWKTWWFISFVILLILLSIYLYIRLRVASLQKAKIHLENEVVKRTATIVQQKEEIEAQRDEIEQQRDFVIQQRDMIAIQNKSINDSILYASRIQNALLPPDELLKELLPEYFIYYSPMHIVSGDFYWIGERSNQVVLMVADCTGHGVPGALMSMLGMSLTNEVFAKTENIQANIFLDMLRDHVKRSLHQTGKVNEANDGFDASVLVFDKNSMHLQYAGANNPLILIRNNELIKYNPDKMSVSIGYDEKPFTNIDIVLQKDDCLYIFSDGYADQLGGPKDMKFMTKQFYNLLLEINPLTMNSQSVELQRKMEVWKSKRPQNDDILVVGIRI